MPIFSNSRINSLILSSGIFEALIFARVLQAVGSGVLLPITQIVIFKIIPEEKWQVFMGLFGFIIGILLIFNPGSVILIYLKITGGYLIVCERNKDKDSIITHIYT